MKYGSWISVFHLEAKLATVVLLSLCKLYMTKIAAGVIEVLELKDNLTEEEKDIIRGK